VVGQRVDDVVDDFFDQRLVVAFTLGEIGSSNPSFFGNAIDKKLSIKNLSTPASYATFIAKWKSGKFSS
jgi:hypothetical protein